MRVNLDYPGILRELFPGHPARHLLCKSVHRNEFDQAKKDVVTVHSGACIEDYSKHLDRQSADGAGALGVIPTFPKTIGPKNRWFVRFLALDFDAAKLTDVMPLIAVLEEYRVYVYLDQGTTGRGVHLYLFLFDPLPQREAHEVVEAVADLSKRMGLPNPEIWPSSAYGPCKGIFLPYRGAAEDGLGANPLVDPASGVQMPLDSVENEIVRTEAGDLRDFVENVGGNDSENTASHEPSYESVDTSTYGGALGAWEAEVARLKEEWVEGKRQNLTLGATAYGISLGIPDERITADIETLERASSNPEVDDRLRAVNGTIQKYVKGERIAWRSFYDLAGVRPPAGVRGVPWEVLLRLMILEDRLSSIPFKGMAGFTDQDVLEALIEVGKKYGKLHPEGVEVSISMRDLALTARVSRDTIFKSLSRLTEDRWIRRSSRGVGTNSGSLLLLINDEDVNSHKLGHEDETANEKVIIHIPRFRWGGGKLGKTVRPILQILQRLQPCTRADVARAMERESRGIRNPMNRLCENTLVDYDEGSNTYTLPAGFEDRLWEVLFSDGTLDTDYKHERRFKRDREMYRALLVMKRGMGERWNSPARADTFTLRDVHLF